MRIRLFSAAAGGFIAALAVVSVPAEAADIRSKVPFSFVVNGRTLPPGTYGLANVNGLLWVRGNTDVAVLTHSGASNDAEPKLVFHKYGERYILRQVCLGDSFVRKIGQSRLEDQLLDSRDAAVVMERVVVGALSVPAL